MKHLEDNLQIACVKWFRLQYPNILVHHSPNGGRRDAREGARFKAMGTLAGFPDLFIPYPNKFFNGLFIELKSDKGVLSDNQKEVLSYLSGQNYICYVCRNIDNFIEVVNNYLKEQ